MIISEAPAKVILFGEHSVVYGYPALAAAISLKTTVEIKEKNISVSLLRSDPLDIEWRLDKEAPETLKPLEKIIEIIENESNKNLRKGLYIRIKSDVKPGSGLGSSASVAVALTGALFKYHDWNIDLNEINRIAYEAEKVAHGMPSGIDNTIATYGGFVKFVKKESSPLIEKAIIDGTFPIVLVDTGLGRSTKVAVSKVRELFQKHNSFVKKIFETIGSIAESVWNHIVLRKIDLNLLGDLMNLNHGLLNAIGVSNRIIEEIVDTAKKLGALGAKITGAGLGGYVMILPPPGKEQKLVNELKKKYRDVYLTTVSNAGLMVSKRI